MSIPSPIFSDVDYERDGKQVGYLHLSHSVTRSAYGNITIPIACIRNGRGPTLFLMAGNHGDEYEGQIVLARLIRTLEPGAIQGRVIIMPAANLPAALAGTRVSPIDNVNFNRAFPGDPEGTPTYQIAHYVDSVLLPLADYHLDLHSGGGSLVYLPLIAMLSSGDAARDAKARAAMLAFGARYAQIWHTLTDRRFEAMAAMRRGCVTLNGEFGGGGALSVEGLRIAARGVDNLLAHVGILPPSAARQGEPTTLVEVRDRSYYVYATERGLFEPFCELGETVAAGQACGQVVFIDNPAREPVVCHFQRAGLVICKRHPGLVERGDCVAHLATEVSP